MEDVEDCSVELCGGLGGTLHRQEVWGAVFFFLWVLWMEPKALGTTGLHPQPLSRVSRMKCSTQSKHSLSLICLTNPENIY